MDEALAKHADVAAFLRGEPEQVASIEAAVRLAIRSFQLRDRDLESDLAQESLSRVLFGLSAGQFRGESSLRTYAGNVARYTCLEHLRKRRRETQPDADELVSMSRWSLPEASFLAEEEHERNLEAFAALPSDCQELLRMISLEGASYREVASRLGVSEAALKSRVHRCRSCLRESSSLARNPARRSARRIRP
jgi:RNA polymerase sigma-70 factor (ECF subfamily)